MSSKPLRIEAGSHDCSICSLWIHRANQPPFLGPRGFEKQRGSSIKKTYKLPSPIALVRWETAIATAEHLFFRKVIPTHSYPLGHHYLVVFVTFLVGPQQPKMVQGKQNWLLAEKLDSTATPATSTTPPDYTLKSRLS